MNTYLHAIYHPLNPFNESLSHAFSSKQNKVLIVASIIFALIALWYMSRCCYAKMVIKIETLDTKPELDDSIDQSPEIQDDVAVIEKETDIRHESSQDKQSPVARKGGTSTSQKGAVAALFEERIVSATVTSEENSIDDDPPRKDGRKLTEKVNEADKHRIEEQERAERQREKQEERKQEEERQAAAEARGFMDGMRRGEWGGGNSLPYKERSAYASGFTQGFLRKF